MTLVLKPEMLEAAYEYLRTTPPFRAWKLPPADEVEFRVTRDPSYCGEHDDRGDRFNATHIISISAVRITDTIGLIETMAHEMCHMHEALHAAVYRADHGTAFKKYAARVCKAHGFNLERF